MPYTTALVLLGGLVILALSAYLCWLLVRLRRQRQGHRQVQQEMDRSNQDQHEHRRKSMELICMAALSGDCDLSEACIRIHNLLHYYPGLAADGRFSVIGEMYEQVSGFDTHEARRALQAGERRAQDAERHAIEQRYRQDLLASFVALRDRMVELEGSAFDIDLATGVDRATGEAGGSRGSRKA